MDDISSIGVPGLLRLYANTIEELRRRGVVRTSNNPTGDVAEYLFCRAFDLTQAPASERSFDARAQDGTRYQIKGRRMTRHNNSRQLSALRALPDKGFDYLAGAIFNEDFSVLRAVIISHETVLRHSIYNEYTNSWRFLLRDGVWDLHGAKDATHDLKNVKY